MSIAFLIISLFVTAGSFLPLWKCDNWMVRGWDFPRLQLLNIALAALCARLFLGFGGFFPDGLAALLLVASIIHLGMRIWPYQRFAKKDVADGTGDIGIRLLVSNVLQDNREIGKLIDLVRAEDPDMLIALETDKRWIDGLEVLKDLLPHTVEVPQSDTYGLLLMSRIPFENAEVKYLIRENIPSVHGIIRLSGGPPVRFHALHPKPPFPDEDTTSTDRDVELIVVAEEIRKTGGPTIVFGDMNDVAWSHTTRLFCRVSGLLDLRVGRGHYSTFSADHWWMRWPLDHVFVSADFRVREIRRLPSIGSDHFPILAHISYEPEHGDTHEPEATEEDLEERNKKLS